MNFLLALTLLLFELSFKTGHGHSIPKLEMVNGTDIYEIDEGNTTALKLINPKPDLPTLREIIYYHIIEKPYGDNQVNKHNEIEGRDLKHNEIEGRDLKHNEIEGRDLPLLELDFDQTRRPFTNGHGYQFLDEDHSRKDEKEDMQRESGNVPEVTVNADSKNMSKDASANTTNEEVIEDKIVADDAKDSQKTKASATDAVAEPEISVDDDSEKEVRTYLSSLKKDSRDRLFEQLKKRYQKDKKSSDKTSRRKRDLGLEDLPPAPVLPAINYDILPDYVRRMISTEKPNIYKERDLLSDDGVYNEIFDDDDEEEEDSSEIERRIDEILATLKPFEGDDESDEHEQHEERKEYEEREEHVEPPKKTQPKTYGMDLKGDHGIVWNDLWSDPGVFFNVGEQDTDDVILEPKDEPSQMHVTTEKPKPTDNDQDIFININKFTTPSPMDKTEKPDVDEKVTPNDEPSSTDKLNEEHSEKAIENITPTAETAPSSKDQLDEANKENNEKSSKLIDKIISEGTTPLSIDKGDEYKPKYLKLDEDTTDTHEKANPEEKVKSVIGKKEGKTGHHPGEDKKNDVFVEILKDERFWKWLAEWTSAYMEHFTKHIRKIAIEEIHKYFKDHHKDVKDAKDVPIEAEKDIADKPGVNKPQESEPTVKNNNLIVDGKKIPITHTSNLVVNITDELNMLKGRKDKKKNQHQDLNKTESLMEQKEKQQTNLIVKAQNIYGNAAGSDKVTNIFVFYPNTESDKTYDEIHPMKNDTGDIFIFGTKQNKTEDNIVANENKNITVTPLEEPVDLDKEQPKESLENKDNLDEIKTTTDKSNSDAELTANKNSIKETETSTIAPKHIEDGAKPDDKSDLDKDDKDNEIDKPSNKTDEPTTMAPENNSEEPGQYSTETSKGELNKPTEEPVEMSTKAPEDKNEPEEIKKKELETLKDASDKPTDVTEKPTIVSEKSTEVSKKPIGVLETPIDVSVKPEDVITKASGDKKESTPNEKEESKAPANVTEKPVDVNSQIPEDVKPSDKVDSSKPTEDNIKDATTEVPAKSTEKPEESTVKLPEGEGTTNKPEDVEEETIKVTEKTEAKSDVLSKVDEDKKEIDQPTTTNKPDSTGDSEKDSEKAIVGDKLIDKSKENSSTN